MEEASGYGFELTFRLKRENAETAPPTWPAVLMQALAKYVFKSGTHYVFSLRLPVANLSRLWKYI